MSEYDGCYIRVVGSPAMYAVDNGKKKLVKSQDEMYELGLRKVRIVLEDEFKAIPFAGAKKAAKKK